MTFNKITYKFTYVKILFVSGFILDYEDPKHHARISPVQKFFTIKK